MRGCCQETVRVVLRQPLQKGTPMKRKRIIRSAVVYMLMLLFLSGVWLRNTVEVKAGEVKETLSDGTYSIPVSLWHATKDQESLGNKSLYQTGKLVVTEGKGMLYLKFSGMEFSGMSGYLLQLDLIDNIKFNEFNYPEEYTLIPAEVISTYAVVDAFNGKESEDVNAAGKRYPKAVALPVEQGTEYLWAHVYVPVMGSLGFGDQVCRIKLSFGQAAEITEEEAALWEEYEREEPEAEAEKEKVEEVKDEKEKAEAVSQPDIAEKDTTGKSTAEKDITQKESADGNLSEENASGDTKELKTVYAEAKKLLQQEDKYTKASLNKLQAAVETAGKALNAGSGQAVLDARTKALKAAMEELVKKAEQVLDKEKLADGKYSVYVDLWHASTDKASMGNPAFNHEALLTVKGGDYTLAISTRPMTVGGITACLQTLQVKQADGSYEYAEITASNNPDNQPSVFQFRLPSKAEYTDVLIDPKVEIVTKDVLPARLKISWDTLKALDENAAVTGNTQSAGQGEAAPAADLMDEAAGVRTTADANVLPAGTAVSEPLEESKENEGNAENPQAGDILNAASGNADTNEEELFSGEEGRAITGMLLGISLLSSFVITILVIITILRTAEGSRRKYEI